MREFLDAILEEIGSESLTDEEYASTAPLELTEEYSVETYAFLKLTLEAREAVSEQVERLYHYYIFKGADLAASSDEPTPVSNIFVGSCL